jgi:serine protease Do
MTARRTSRWLSVAFLGVGALVGATCSRTVQREDQRTESSPVRPVGPVFAASPAFAQAAATGASPTLADIAERAVPSVVNLSATRRVDVADQRKELMRDPMLREFFGPRGMPDLPRDREMRSLGSGVIVGDGVVLTSAHVVEKADQVEISLKDGREVYGTVVGADARSDLAVVRIKDKVSGLKALPLGDSAHMRAGDVVLAIGDPFGVGQTVTMGIVSATGRSSMGIVDYEDFIQTDAAINPGNSGGALVNMKGELIGINTAILSGTGGSMGIGFAIPSEMASPIMKSLLEKGRVTRGYLGVAIQDLDRDLAEGLDLREHDGILVADVTPGSPAEKAGLVRGDVIRSLDGRKLDSSSRFRNEVAATSPGSEVTLEVVRGGKSRTVKVRLETLKEKQETTAPAPGAQGARPGGGNEDARGGLLGGLAVVDLSAQLRRRLNVPAQIRGVVVTDVAPQGAADRLGLRPGDVVMELDRQPVTSPSELRRQARAAAERDRVVAVVYREGSTIYLATHE